MMKLTLSLPVLIILGKFVFAQAYLMRDLDFTRPLPLRIELNNRPRRTCIDHNGRCALITYNVDDRKYIRVLNTTCNCDEGTECLYDRDILTDCEGNEDCLLSRNLLLNFNLSAYQYVCKPKQNLCTSDPQEEYSTVLERSIRKKIDHLDNEVSNIDYEIARVVQADKYEKYEKKTPHLDYQLARFDYEVASLEQFGTQIQNLTIHPENEAAHIRISQLNRRIRELILRTEQLKWNVGRISMRIRE